jgi:hypothetical protein
LAQEDGRELLAKFWQCIRETWTDRQVQMGRFEAFKTEMLSQMSFDVSPEFLSKLQEERQQIGADHRTTKAQKEQLQTKDKFMQPSWDVGKGEDGAVRRKLPKKSNALRNDPSIEERLQDMTLEQARPKDNVAASIRSSSTSRIPVKQDTLSLMAKMFPAGADGTSGVRWIQFVQALTDAGMIATQGAGSAVSFNIYRRSISFHKHHPEPLVDAVRLRGFGKRLSKWFGWTNETFILRQKDCNEGQQDASE